MEKMAQRMSDTLCVPSQRAPLLLKILLNKMSEDLSFHLLHQQAGLRYSTFLTLINPKNLTDR